MKDYSDPVVWQQFLAEHAPAGCEAPPPSGGRLREACDAFESGGQAEADLVLLWWAAKYCPKRRAWWKRFMEEQGIVCKVENNPPPFFSKDEDLSSLSEEQVRELRIHAFVLCPEDNRALGAWRYSGDPVCHCPHFIKGSSPFIYS